MLDPLSATMKFVVLLMLFTVSFAASAQLLDANTATREELAALPHMEDDLVDALIISRPFTTVSALNDQLGAGLEDEQLQELYAHVFVPINLNTAAKEDILLIPGVGAKMAREFEEYRPYSNIEQFRREIGKYVDAEEVARLEQYVTLE
jgi:DNA uptake protein ComE-like DNA-binding protein